MNKFLQGFMVVLALCGVVAFFALLMALVLVGLASVFGDYVVIVLVILSLCILGGIINATEPDYTKVKK